jgi:uncharacterized OsmC-like protein
MADVASEFTIEIEQRQDYEFVVKFDRPAIALLTDEQPPLGKGEGPSPSRMLAAAVGNCLSASLLFCARKARVDVKKIRTMVKVQTVRNEKKRQRIGRIEVVLAPEFAEADLQNASRCIDIFQDYCTVTESVRQGIEVAVQVKGSAPQTPQKRTGAAPAE